MSEAKQASRLYLGRTEDGTLHSNYGMPSHCVWTLTDYTDQPCDPDDCECACHDVDDEGNLDIDCGCVGPYDCAECGQPIYGEHYVNLDDGSDSAHIGCTVVVDISGSWPFPL